MRTVYLGTSEFAATVLSALARTPHRPSLVVTRPDRRKGRGQKLSPPPVAERARSLDLSLLQPEKLHEEEPLAAIASISPDVLLVCAYGVLIKEPLLSDYEMLNVHPSLLPRWRGAAPVERAIMSGDAETGVSIMRLTAGLDSGPVCLQEREMILPDDDYGTLAGRLAELGARLLVQALDSRPSFSEQPAAGVTYADKIGPEDRTLDPARSPAANELVVRALRPHIGTRIALGAELLGVHDARVAGGARTLPAPGEVALCDDGSVLWACGDGALELVVVQPPGGRAMDAGAWARGRRDLTRL